MRKEVAQENVPMRLFADFRGNRAPQRRPDLSSTLSSGYPYTEQRCKSRGQQPEVLKAEPGKKWNRWNNWIFACHVRLSAQSRPISAEQFPSFYLKSILTTP